MSVHVSASAPRASLPLSGRRARCGARHPPRVVPSAFGFGRSNQGPTLEQIEAEIRSAPPSTSPASTSRLSLADATWKVSLDNPLPVRDRAACAIAAEAVQALCETGLDGASLAVTLGIREAMIANGFGDSVRAVAGYVSIGGEGRAHAWLEIDGRVLDVAGEGLALCEAARRLGVDYSDVQDMRSAFGPDALALLRTLSRRSGRMVPPSLLEEASWATPVFASFARMSLSLSMRRSLAYRLREAGVTESAARDLARQPAPVPEDPDRAFDAPESD